LSGGDVELFVRKAALVGLRRGGVIVVCNLGESGEMVVLPEGRWTLVFSSRRSGGATAVGLVEVEAETTMIFELG